MNNTIKYLFIAGLCCLGLAWSFFVNKTSSEIKTAKAKSYDLKADLIELRWGQIMNREVGFGLDQGPEVFNIELAGLDKNILGSEFVPKYSELSASKVKAAYIDAGTEVSFFTTKIDGETFFVKVKGKDEGVMLQGYTYAYVLNLLNAGLSESEWYFLDAKNKVVFSHEASYLGRSKSFKAAVSKSVKLGESVFSIQMVDPSPYSSAGILWFGLLGLFLIGFANLPSTSFFVGDYYKQNSLETQVGAIEENSDEVDNSEDKVKHESEGVIAATSSRVERRYKAIEESQTQEEEFKAVVANEENQTSVVTNNVDDVEDDVSEGFTTLNLNSVGSASFSEQDEEGYSEFLTENPSLTMTMPAIPNKQIIEEKKASNQVKGEIKTKPKNMPPLPVKLEVSETVLTDEEASVSSASENGQRSGNDWIKLAEELSANLEKFAGEWREGSSETDQESEA